MGIHRYHSAAILATIAGLSVCAAGQSTAFTYQGQVSELGGSIPSVLDIRFALFDSASGGAQIGSTLCTDNIVIDSQGRFTVTLDFGAQYSSTLRHLEVSLRSDASLPCTNLTGFTTLSPRQIITSAPLSTWSTQSANALSLGGNPAAFYTNAANLSTGTLATARLPAQAARTDTANSFTAVQTFSNVSNVFVGSGAGLTALNASNIASGTVADARLTSNVARRDQNNTFTGLTNAFFGNFVGINRTTPVTGSDRFSIANQPSVGGYVGMYITSDQTTGQPFYGYTTPSANAWTSLNNNGDFQLFMSGTPRFQVGRTGETTISMTQSDIVTGLAITGLAAQGTSLSIRNSTNNPWLLFADGAGGPSGNGKLSIRNSPGGPALTTFDTTGNVGINDPTPQSKLTVGGTDQWAPSIGNGFGDFTISDATSTHALSMGVSTTGAGAGTARIWTRGNKALALGTSTGPSTDLLWINGSGSVGIGTNSGLAPLSFPNTLGNKIALYLADSTNQFGMGISDFTMRLYTPLPSDIIALGSGNATTFAESFRVSNGKIGVGDTVLSKSVNVRGGMALDTFNENNGVSPLTNGLTFGFGSGEGIASRRASGVGQNGLDFYTAFVSRIFISNSGNVGIGTSTPAAKLDVAGLARVHAIDITGGSDLSEGFKISPALDVAPVAGHVVVMDAANPGQLMVASKPYDSSVVGVISGANGIKPGMMMRQEGTIADGSQPVALTGRVYVMVDATHAPIQMGDLLTTSNTPGHAMKATDSTRAYGAVIGKAMEPLPQGKGMVLVLINLH